MAFASCAAGGVLQHGIGWAHAVFVYNRGLARAASPKLQPLLRDKDQRRQVGEWVFRVLEEHWSILFEDEVSNELQCPTAAKHAHSDAPIQKKHRQRQSDQRDAEQVSNFTANRSVVRTVMNLMLAKGTHSAAICRPLGSYISTLSSKPLDGNGISLVRVPFFQL